MKRFVTATFISLGLLLSFGVGNKLYVDSLLRSICDSVKPRNLVFGDSHGEQIRFPESLNFSHSGDPIAFQHQCFIKVYPECHDIQNVMISAGPHDFASFKTKRLTDRRSSWLNGNTKRVFAFWNGVGDSNLALGIAYFKGALSFLKKTDILANRAWGTNSNLTEKGLKSTLGRHGVKEVGWFAKSNHDLYLSFIQSIETSGVNHIWIVGTPLHRDYLQRIEEGGWIAYKESMQKLSLNPQVQYISLEEADLPDEFYKDCDHLNENGHHWLADTLNSLITEANIQATGRIAPLTSPK
jgi:hypothetical protein